MSDGITEQKEREESKCPKCGSVLQDITLLNAIKGFFCPRCSTHLIAFISVFLADLATKEVMPIETGIPTNTGMAATSASLKTSGLAAQQEMERKALGILHEDYDDDHTVPVKRVAKFMATFAIHENAKLRRQVERWYWRAEATERQINSAEAQLREKERELSGARSAAFREVAQICEDEGAREACAVAEILRGKVAELERIAEGSDQFRDSEEMVGNEEKVKVAPKGEEKP